MGFCCLTQKATSKFMMDIPFTLKTVPARDAVSALERLSREQPDTVPVLLGDADIFSAEWAETVDLFEAPEALLDEARAIDIDAWFDGQATQSAAAEARARQQMRSFNRMARVVALPFDLLVLPLRLLDWARTGHRPTLFTRPAVDQPHPAISDPMVDMLTAQLADLEAAGEGTEEELADIRQIIADIAANGTTVFPDPVDYITPRRGENLAAGMMRAHEPWEVAAWLQHGTYAACTPKPVLVALCKWLWEQHGGRIITASTDHIGFQMDRPIATQDEAETVLGRFSALGASEVNADHRGSGGSSLVGAPRLWVWWD